MPENLCHGLPGSPLQQPRHTLHHTKIHSTGNVGRSEDIEAHRRLMRTGLLPEDHEELTMPEIFSYPASPLLAARIDGRPHTL